MTDVLTVAAYICNRYQKRYLKKIDEMKLHKLMYFAQRESLIQTDEPLFEATFQGRKYGPVLEELREPYCGRSGLPKVSVEEEASLKKVMDVVFARYAPKESMSLCYLSQGELSWKNSRIDIPMGENSENPMSLEDIREDAKRIKKRRAAVRLDLSLQGVLV